MAETTLTDRVLETLVTAGLLTADQVASVREAASDGPGVARLLVERGLVTSEDVGTALENELGVPRVDLASYAPDDEALALMPASIARGRKVLPLFEIDGTLTAAVGDPMDVFGLDEVSAQIGVEFDPVLTDPTSLLGAIVQYYGDAAAEEVAPPPPVASAPAVEAVPDETAAAAGEADIAASIAAEVADVLRPVVGAAPAAPVAAEAAEAMPDVSSASLEEMAVAEAQDGHAAVDLDVLAVADGTRVALLVTDILNDAASRGATKVHLLPYKDDFFLVYRVKGRLEKVASAPLSLQGALAEGFKSFARVGIVGAGVPALGRVRTRLADQDLVLTVSAVPTIAGQRVVASLAPFRSEPRDLGALGMTEAEVRALHAMVERGRGILLVAAPVAEGRSATYYALLAHAAAAGKTAYSVETSVEFELPAVAQVLVNASSAVPAASYFAAGLRQDTDVLAIDGIGTVDDIHVAVEAAGKGRLVIATVAAAGIASAVRRMLDLGAEPYSLASALTLGVGQRLVRTNCPNCTVEKPSEALARIPGAAKDLVSRTGTGCPNCGKTGFGGTTGIFEVLPFTDPVRTAVAAGLSASDLEKVALAAGMRPLGSSGLAKVTSGLVSADELDRVMRFPR